MTRPSLPGTARGSRDPLGPTVTLVTFPDYALAQRAVDYLSDNGFPVGRTAIVGTDLRLVERVLGRMTVARAALAGAASGAWFGLLIGLLIALFSTASWGWLILAAIVIGAAWGAIFGAVAHAMTGGQRDFASTSRLEAAQYAVAVQVDHADEARALLTRMNWQASQAEVEAGSGDA
jgi:Heat induced stress protein YflT domain